MSNRLDLLKKNAGNDKEETKKKSSRSDIFSEKIQKAQQDKHSELTNDHDRDDEFKNESDYSDASEYDIDDEDNDNSDENVNVIEINLDESQGLDPSILEDDFDQDEEQVKTTNSSLKEEEAKAEDHSLENEIVEGSITIDYSEEDIKEELEYTFDHREEIYHIHFKIIKDGGMEINSHKVFELGDIIRVSITLTELKEQVGCEARIVSIYPKSIRSSNEENTNQYRYMIQFIGPNASETERVVSKYLLGYKIK
ncbi:PilZ domain-containing protein [Francisella sp. 19X1-34]|uniref:PilZ domain-containing protein n=1 Tax=Francisella sp. 19X1-34 TaxID=3087177 RepID=UPI002E31AADD|nr:PilZ domain-containing protein [Francisella sp. 19X1-34]MED7787711.1 PilZ domain-containing protein [Francisella sp. 19X1-34]